MTRRREPTLSLEPVDTPEPGTSALRLTLADGRTARVPLGASPVRIGGLPSCDLHVDDPHASGVHAEVHLTGAGVILRDLDSTNGTFVGGVAIKEAVLAPGAVFFVGTSRIAFEMDDPGAAEWSPDDAPAGFGSAIGAAPSMRAVFALLTKLAPSEVTLTLIGETGTGKDVLARGVHEASARAGGPMIVFDCGAVAASLIESELFGHERGAFTGAVAERAGAFERASGGTLFLDEVGELPLELQPRLLRVLEQRTVRRVGGAAEISVDVRVIAATNRDLAAESAAGRFRRDLFYRLCAAVVQVPPLRDRREDLPALIERILADLGRPVMVSPAALAALQNYDWPGNVRELRNVIESAAPFIDGPVLEPRHLMFFAPRQESTTGASALENLPLGGQTLEDLERAAIRQTLEREGGNKTRAARALGIAASTLYEKIKKYGL
jgi:transcriptional regulator with PAS, ATPase and Fis domain